MPKVLFVNNLPDVLGGSERIMLASLRHMDRDRVDLVAAVAGPGPMQDALEELRIPVHLFPPVRLQQLHRTAANAVRMARVVRDERPDLIVNWLTKSQLFAAPAQSLAGMRRRIVWWQHDVPAPTVADRLATLLPALAVGTYSIAAADAQRAYRPHRDVFTVVGGIEEPRSVGSDEIGELRRRLGIPRDRVVAVLVGRLLPWKGQDRFLRAVALAVEAGHDLHALIVGGDAYDLAPGYEASLHALPGVLGIADRVTFTGHVDDATPHVALADVLVNASDPEPFGLVLLEGMAAGTPVVAIDIGGPREIVEPDRSGLLLRDGSPATISGALAALASDSGLRARLAAGGRRRYEARFTAARMGAAMTDELVRLSALAGRPR